MPATPPGRRHGPGSSLAGGDKILSHRRRGPPSGTSSEQCREIEMPTPFASPLRPGVLAVVLLVAMIGAPGASSSMSPSGAAPAAAPPPSPPDPPAAAQPGSSTPTPAQSAPAGFDFA